MCTDSKQVLKTIVLEGGLPSKMLWWGIWKKPCQFDVCAQGTTKFAYVYKNALRTQSQSRYICSASVDWSCDQSAWFLLVPTETTTVYGVREHWKKKKINIKLAFNKWETSSQSFILQFLQQKLLVLINWFIEK